MGAQCSEEVDVKAVLASVTADFASAMDAESRRRVLVANEWVIFATVTLSSVLTALIDGEGREEVFVGFLTYGLTTALALALAWRGHIRTALYGHTLQVFVCNVAAFIVLQDIPGHMVLAMVNFVLLHVAVLGRRSAVVTTVLMVLCLAFTLGVAPELKSVVDSLPVDEGSRMVLGEPVTAISLLTTTLSTGFLILTTVGILESSRAAVLEANRDLEAVTVELRERHDREHLLVAFGAVASASTSSDALRDAVVGTVLEGVSGHHVERLPGDAADERDVLLESGPEPQRLRFDAPIDAAARRFVDTVVELYAGALARIVAEARLREAERLESVGRLAASVAHDFNNLLVPVVSAAETIRLSAGIDARNVARAEAILGSTTRATAVVSKLLSHARSRETETRDVEVGALLVRSDGLMRSFLRGGTTLTVLVPEDEAAVRVDPTELEQVLLNLFINACEAVGEDGAIEVSAFWDDELVHLEVSDSGPGVPPELRDWVFGPFHSTRVEGSGLGLATVARIVEQSGGLVGIEESELGGACFRITLPRRPLPEAGANAPVPVAVPRGSLTVLLVDDDEGVRLGVADMLSALGHRAVVVEDGAEALDRLREDACIDVVLTDFQMPGLTGSDLIHQMRQRGDRRPVILTSGYGADLVTSGQETPDLVLGKPVRLSDLGQALRTLAG